MKRTMYRRIALVGIAGLLLCAPSLSHAVVTTTFKSTLGVTAIGPYDDSKVMSTINVPDDIIIENMRVTINLSHGWAGDVIADLLGPDGNSLNLIEFPDPGNTWDEFVQSEVYTFSDNGFSPLPDKGVGGIIPGGEYLPHASVFGDFSFFAGWKGTSAKGFWTLEVLDTWDKLGDPFIWGGELFGWELEITSSDSTTPPVPIPGAFWLLGSATASIIGLRRKGLV